MIPDLNLFLKNEISLTENYKKTEFCFVFDFKFSWNAFENCLLEKRSSVNSLFEMKVSAISETS